MYLNIMKYQYFIIYTKIINKTLGESLKQRSGLTDRQPR